MAAGENTYLESDGKSVNVDLLYTTPALEVVYVDGFLGITVESGVSGDTVALNIDQREYQFTVPTALGVSKSDTVYIILANVDIDHAPPDDAYSLTSGAGKKALFKATSDQDDNDVVTGILLPEGV